MLIPRLLTGLLQRLRPRRRILVLSIDGGGIRGLIPARILENLETRLQERGVTAPLGDVVDLVSGSSTGALVALGIALPPNTGITYLHGISKRDSSGNIRMQSISDIYHRMGKTIFPPDRFLSLRMVRQAFIQKYSAAPFERLLKAIFGSATLQECRTNVLISAYDTVRRSPHLFKNRLDRPGSDPNFYLRDVARATSAAPTYFKPALIQDIPFQGQEAKEYCLIDGAIYSNNPAMSAYIEARKIFPRAKRFTIVSLGSGELHVPYHYADIKNWGYMDWVSPMRNVPIFTIMNDAQTIMTDYQLTKLPGVDYHRINLPLSSDIAEDMDDCSDSNIAALEEFAARVIAEHESILDMLADQMASCRPRR